MLLKIYNKLYKEFGQQGWWPINSRYSGGPKNAAEQFEVCIGAILTQNTAWKNVEKALENLRNAGALSREKLVDMSPAKLAKLIKPAGYYNQKARKIKEFLKFNGEITRENLLSIWGIGPETADSILLYAYNKPYFVIDAYTKRICARLGLCEENCSYDELQQFFHKTFDAENPKLIARNSKLFNEFHALFVELAKKHCTKKPKCGGCPISSFCKYHQVYLQSFK